jgi:hypothetical protein
VAFSCGRGGKVWVIWADMVVEALVKVGRTSASSAILNTGAKC